MPSSAEIRQLIALLNAPDVKVRQKALTQLRRVCGPRFGNLVSRLYDSKEPAVRYASLYVLSTLPRDDFALNGYSRLAHDVEPGIRYQAISMLAAFNRLEAAYKLVDLVQSAKDEQTRSHCVKALRYLKSQASTEIGKAIQDRLMVARKRLRTTVAKSSPMLKQPQVKKKEEPKLSRKVAEIDFPSLAELENEADKVVSAVSEGFTLQIEEGPALPKEAVDEARSLFEATGTFRLPNELADFFDKIEQTAAAAEAEEDTDGLPSEDEVAKMMTKMAAALRELTPRDRSKAEGLIREGKISTTGKLKSWAARQAHRANQKNRRNRDKRGKIK